MPWQHIHEALNGFFLNVSPTLRFSEHNMRKWDARERLQQQADNTKIIQKTEQLERENRRLEGELKAVEERIKVLQRIGNPFSQNRPQDTGMDLWHELTSLLGFVNYDLVDRSRQQTQAGIVRAYQELQERLQRAKRDNNRLHKTLKIRLNVERRLTK